MITEQFCDDAMKVIRFDKNNMELAIAKIRTNWVSKLYAYQPSEVSVVTNILDILFRLMYNRKLWMSLDVYIKKSVLGFLYRNKTFLQDSKALTWENAEEYRVFQSVGNSYWFADVRE